MEERKLARWLSRYDGPPLTLMEVCGTHTSALYRSGIRQMLPPQITFLSGPGCPVCVTRRPTLISSPAMRSLRAVR